MNDISPTARISTLADIEESVRGSKLSIGDNVYIDSFVKIRFVGGAGDITIGTGAYINAGTVIYSGNGVSIGNDVLIAANCTLAPVNHEHKDRSRRIVDQGFAPSKGGIIIEDDVWIGAGTVILDGAVIERGCVVGAHSLVNGRLEAFSVSAGSPARVIGYRE